MIASIRFQSIRIRIQSDFRYNNTIGVSASLITVEHFLYALIERQIKFKIRNNREAKLSGYTSFCITE